VSSIQDRSELFANIMRLRRAQRDAPGNREIAAVRTSLEQQLGKTVSLRLAASLLGVSHTALRRWIQRGDVARVFTPEGRIQVPVSTLFDLYEQVEDQRSHGRRHLLEPGMLRAEKRARSIRSEPIAAEIDQHRKAQLRNLSFHREIARRLRRPMVEEAKHRIWAWRQQGQIDAGYADEWERVLNLPLPDIRRVITDDSPPSADLRQNSPFAGMLTEPERRAIFAPDSV
jgi:hypothetical protein